MITKEDIDQVNELISFLNPAYQDPLFNKKYGWQALIQRMAYNLTIAKDCYKPVSDQDKKTHYYTAICNKCGWWGSSKFLGGGHQIADTGDCYDVFCPVCGNDVIDEKDE